MSTPNRDRNEKSSSSDAQPAGERRRDEERPDHGPAYHGGDWSKADAEGDRASDDQPAEEEVRSDVERVDEEIDDPGTRGAVFGKGGKGIVEREADDEPTAKKS